MKIQLDLKTFNVNECEKALIVKCLELNLSAPYSEITKMLGISQRNFYRLLKKYDIKSNRVLSKLDKAKYLLESNGYKIKKP